LVEHRQHRAGEEEGAWAESHAVLCLESYAVLHQQPASAQASVKRLVDDRQHREAFRQEAFRHHREVVCHQPYHRVASARTSE
jgi:hypothetical protein